MTHLGYQASSLKPHLTTPDSLRASFHKLHDIGYKHLQLQWIDPAVPLETTAEILKEIGLECIATQDKFEVIEKDFDYFLQMNRLWSSPSLCISTIPRERMTPDGLKWFASELHRMAKTLAAHGIGLSFHPVAFNYEQVDGVCAVDALMELLSPEIRLTLCVMHAIQSGVDPIALLERYGSRIDVCHFKDFARFPDGKEYLVPVGQGEIDWPPIFDACHQAGVKWGLAEQETWQKDAFVCAKESYDFITAHGIK